MKSKSERWFSRIGCVVLGTYTIIAMLPLVLLVVSSFSSEASIIKKGYALIPSGWSLDAYRYILGSGGQILKAYGMSILVTAVGTLAGLSITIMFAYTLSRKDLPGVKIFSFAVFFSMMFHGGLVPNYLMWTTVFHIKNTFWAQLIPTLLMDGFYVFVARTFITKNIPRELIDAAAIDGASEFRTFFSIVVPLCKPVATTVGLFIGINYWNNWTNGLYYVNKSEYYNIQNVLTTMINNMEYLQRNATAAAKLSGAIASAPSTTVRMAMAVIGLLPVMIIYPMINKYLAKGILAGSLKG